MYPAVDILDGFDQILARLNDSRYDNDYDVQLDLYRVVMSAYDGHFGYQAEIISVFSFDRASPIYSISDDGIALPNIYLGHDIHYLRANASDDGTVSPIVQINGQDVQTYLNEYATLNVQDQDPDANYNALFLQGPSVPGVNFDVFQQSSWYQGTKNLAA